MAERLIRIEPDGGQVTMVFHDDNPLAALGAPTLVRASNVRFDNDEKRWVIYLRFPEGEELRLPETFETRAEAIAFEIEACEGILQRRPNLVEHMFTKGMMKDSEGRKTSG